MIPRTISVLLFGLFLALPAPIQAADKVRAVVVGINDYVHPGWDLDGAVADARDIAGVLRRRGADVTVLLDAEATRAKVTRALEDAIARSESGDVVVFAFAGHGAQMREALPGDEADAMDEIFLFARFLTKGPGSQDLLRDNDFARIVQSVPVDIGFLIVIDSCNSGTMTRSPVAFGRGGKVRTREVSFPAGADFPMPDASTYQAELREQENVVYISGALDGQPIAEVEIDGESRGALSFAIARALEGRADGGDGNTSLIDLRNFVETTVRQYADEMQTPNVRFSGQTGGNGGSEGGSAILRLFNPSNGQRPVVEANRGSDVKLPASPRVFEIAPGTGGDGIPADTQIVWSPGTGNLIDRNTGDLIARPSDKAELDSAILKWRVVQALKRWTIGRPAEITLVEGNGRHKVGSSISIEIQPPVPAPDLRYLTLVNLAGTGVVQYIFPAPQHEADARDVVSVDKPYRAGPIPVIEPVGSDTIVAILTADRPAALRSALRALDGRTAPVELLRVLETHSGSAAVGRVALKQVFTEK